MEIDILIETPACMMEDDFRARVYEIMDEEVIYKFDKREGNAADFYEESDE